MTDAAYADIRPASKTTPKTNSKAEGFDLMAAIQSPNLADELERRSCR
jgi:hypothetical protein